MLESVKASLSLYSPGHRDHALLWLLLSSAPPLIPPSPSPHIAPPRLTWFQLEGGEACVDVSIHSHTYQQSQRCRPSAGNSPPEVRSSGRHFFFKRSWILKSFKNWNCRLESESNASLQAAVEEQRWGGGASLSAGCSTSAALLKLNSTWLNNQTALA